MLTKEQEAEYLAMRYYLAGDCGCCENACGCEFLENFTPISGKGDCLWQFSRSLVREYEQMHERGSI